MATSRSRSLTGWRCIPLALLLAPWQLHAQQHPISWALSPSAPSLRAGHPFTLQLQARIPGGWHLYSLTQPPGGPVATVIAVSGRGIARAGAIDVRDPDVAPDNNFQIVTETYADSVTFAVPVVASAPGVDTATVTVAYQTCTDRYCLPPTREVLAATVRVTGRPLATAAVSSPPGAGRSTAPPPPVAPPLAQPPSIPPLAGTTAPSLPLFLWLAAVMGALSLLTPCVFPMIPITVSYFTRANDTARGTPVRNASIYALGIMATFTILGLAIAVLVGAGGINRFAANPWINLLVTAIFVAFAFNLFGAYQIGLPASLLTRIDHATRRTGGNETAGILLMGLTFTLTSFTCTVPFVGTLLVMAARGNWIWPLAGLLVFSAIFALPFFVLALVPSFASRLPRAGSWMQSVKVIMGFIELATAMKFLSNADLVLHWGIFTRDVVLGIWLLIALVAAAYLLGVFRWRRGAVRRPGAIAMAGALVTFAVAAYIGRGLAGHGIGELESFVPAPEGGVVSGTTAAPDGLTWMINDYAGGLALARAEHKPLMVDFTGYTCTNCRWMEANMFPRASVKQALQRYVRVRLYTDGEGAVYQRQQAMEQAKLGTVALPYYAIIDTLGQVTAQFLGMTRDTDAFVEFLSEGRSSTAP